SEQTFFFDGLDRGERSGAGERMPAIGSAESSRTWRVHDFSAARYSRDGHAAAHGLRHGDQVGFDAEMFGSEPFAGACKSGLDFVRDEEDAVLAADILQEFEVVAGRNDEAAFAENGLDDQGGDGFRRDGALERVFKMMRKLGGRSAGWIAIGVSERNAVNVAGERLEAGFVRMRFAGQ